MRAAVVVFPGSNCDRDIALALEREAGHPPLMVWHRDADLPDVDLIVLPGGFSFGDYLRCGAMAARSPIMAAVRRAAERGVAVLGICNGFQILTEAGLLPGALLRNAALHFICRDVFLSCGATRSRFTVGYGAGEVIRLPVAHNEGNYYADAQTLDRLEGEGRIAFRYCRPDGAVDDEGNPNGSCRNIAGVLNEAGNVLGMMPHPERLCEPLQGGTDGARLFQALMAGVG